MLPIVSVLDGRVMEAVLTPTFFHSILHMRSKSNQISAGNTKEWTSRPDWTNNFGAPLEEGHKTSKNILSGLILHPQPKHKLSRSSDTGCAFVTALPELLGDDVPDRTRHSILPLEEVEITQDVLRRVDTISTEEGSDCRKP